MDDSYIILDDKKRLETIYENIKKMCKELGIFVNETKTYISKLIDWHTFLKINFKVLSTTRVIRKSTRLQYAESVTVCVNLEFCLIKSA